MQRDRYQALMAARDAANEEHRPAIRWASNRIDRLEKKLYEVVALVNAIKRAAMAAKDGEDDLTTE